MNNVVRYYEQTWADYRVMWLNQVNYAFHFGYHDVPGMPHHLALARHNEMMAERAGVQAGDRILDAGCGVGGTACWLHGTRCAGARQDGRQSVLHPPVPARAA